ncbi:F-box protein, partial [Trifolium medium]|nr:F-box protein [Trifolium medium]
IDLGREFVIGSFPSRRPLYINYNNPLDLDLGKVVVCDTWHNGIDGSSLLLAIHGTGELAIFRCGDERWTLIRSISGFHCTDVCVFNGRPIALDIFGRIVAVRPDLSLDLVVEHGYGVYKRFLVESDGELLLLVSGYLSYDWRNNGLEADGEGIFEGAVKFDVFRLDEKEK